MGIVSLIDCNGCGNIILPGEVASLITKGIVIDGGDVAEVENSPLLHFCEDCSQALAAEMSDLLADAMARSEAAAPCCASDPASID